MYFLLGRLWIHLPLDKGGKASLLSKYKSPIFLSYSYHDVTAAGKTGCELNQNYKEMKKSENTKPENKGCCEDDRGLNPY